jgi:hypothetical protein
MLENPPHPGPLCRGVAHQCPKPQQVPRPLLYVLLRVLPEWSCSGLLQRVPVATPVFSEVALSVTRPRLECSKMAQNMLAAGELNCARHADGQGIGKT